MKCTDCENCKWADCSGKERTIVMNGITIVQKGGGINCTHTGSKYISFRGDDMVCSAFEKSDNTKPEK